MLLLFVIGLLNSIIFSISSPVPVLFRRSPVVLVPGDGGSQLEAKLDKPNVPHRWCTRKTSDWFSIWLNLELLAPFAVDCLVDNLKLIYDPETRTTRNNDGVTIQQPAFGNTSGVEWLDPSQIQGTSYFYHIVEKLVSLNYTRNVNIRGAPYDFRKAPNENQGFIKNLTGLIEETYETNGRSPVTLIGHSMGNLYILYMLSKSSQDWKDKYLKTFVSLAAPWGGAVKTLRLMASGDSLGVFAVNPLTARDEQRSMPSSAWMMPYDTFWSSEEILVYGPQGNYTAKDYERFFKDIEFPDGWSMRKDTEHLLKHLPHPGVELHCLHGSGMETPAALHYASKDWIDNQPDVVDGDGDGTVNKRSLEGCLKWMGTDQKHPVHHQDFKGVEHLEILQDVAVLNYLQKIVMTS